MIKLCLQEMSLNKDSNISSNLPIEPSVAHFMVELTPSLKVLKV
jgi:hypothetical protein